MDQHTYRIRERFPSPQAVPRLSISLAGNGAFPLSEEPVSRFKFTPLPLKERLDSLKLISLSSHQPKSPKQSQRGGQGGLKMDGMNRKQRCGHVSSALQPDPAPGRQAPELGG